MHLISINEAAPVTFLSVNDRVSVFSYHDAALSTCHVHSPVICKGEVEDLRGLPQTTENREVANECISVLIRRDPAGRSTLKILRNAGGKNVIATHQ